MSEKALEMEEQEVEVINQTPIVQNDRIESLLRLADNSEALQKAFRRIQRTIMSLALPGDWMKFGSGVNTFLEIGGSGAFRLIKPFGISFKNWKYWEEKGSDEKGDYYTCWYQCDVYCDNQTIEGVMGRAGTRDKFFGYAHEEWKNLSDIKKDDIQTAARRNCMKEGVKVLFGLLHIPVSAAKELGLPENAIRGHLFGQESVAQAESKVTTITEVTVRQGTKNGKAYNIYTVKTADGGSYSTFNETLAKDAKKSKEEGAHVELQIEQKGQYTNLVGLKRVDVSENSSELVGE